MNMTNMQKYAPHFADGALQLQVGVGLTRMAATPRWLRLFCSGTLYGRGFGGWFSPSTGRRSGRYVHPCRGCACTDTLTSQDHKLLTRNILGYHSLFGDILVQPLISKVVSFARWTRFKEEFRDQPLPRGSQART